MVWLLHLAWGALEAAGVWLNTPGGRLAVQKLEEEVPLLINRNHPLFQRLRSLFNGGTTPTPAPSAPSVTPSTPSTPPATPATPSPAPLTNSVTTDHPLGEALISLIAKLSEEASNPTVQSALAAAGLPASTLSTINSITSLVHVVASDVTAVAA